MVVESRHAELAPGGALKPGRKAQEFIATSGKVGADLLC
jgi:hypothetical protein